MASEAKTIRNVRFYLHDEDGSGKSSDDEQNSFDNYMVSDLTKTSKSSDDEKASFNDQVSFDDLKQSLEKNCRSFLDELLKIALEINNVEDIAKDMVVVMIQIFYDDNHFLLERYKTMVMNFGDVKLETAERVFKIVCQLKEEGQSLFDSMIRKSKSDTQSGKVLDEISDMCCGMYYGVPKKIPDEYSFVDCEYQKKTKQNSHQAKESGFMTWLSQTLFYPVPYGENPLYKAEESDDQVNNNQASTSSASYDPGFSASALNEELYGSQWTNKNSEYGAEYQPLWLEYELDKLNIPSMSIEHLRYSIMAEIMSLHTNDDLQGILYELLGYDGLGLIETILSHREEIVYQYKKFTQSCNPKHSPPPHDPLVKWADKDSGLRFNEQHQPAVLQISQCKNGVVREEVIPRYPNVYDQNIYNKSWAGLSKGSLMLPANAVRKNHEKFEQVIVPPPDPDPDNVVKFRHVSVNILGETGQMVFSEIQEFNAIQSLVFNCAYFSNENMLVCAPTGAGKTNIALMTIVNVIRQHSIEGTVQKDKFKVIYIAPMKALAAEIAETLQKRLHCLGLVVKEYTGDMRLTKAEIDVAQVLVCTPEKWDVLTRKGFSEEELTNKVKLLVIDEVHILNSERGPVIENIVARTLRQMTVSQSIIRIVGLSATLPNYTDVARFLGVNLHTGLFFFDNRFRSVPLHTEFIGIKEKRAYQVELEMNQICFDKIVEILRLNKQVMVFVHTRRLTTSLPAIMKRLAECEGKMSLFNVDSSFLRRVPSFVSSHDCDLLRYGFGWHNAGMPRLLRKYMERNFECGNIKVLFCTSTLAWGVNLPAFGVIIRGTEMLQGGKNKPVDLDILDVVQIFGRAGRPQYDNSGRAVLITSHSKLPHYLKLLVSQVPIESSLIPCLSDSLNAEIVLGTITNETEALEWIKYTYFYQRLRLNPLHYGVAVRDVLEEDIEQHLSELIASAAEKLDSAHMIRLDQKSKEYYSTGLGRAASHYYLSLDTIVHFNECIQHIGSMTIADILTMISRGNEFKQMRVRQEEVAELCELETKHCREAVYGDVEGDVSAKVSILSQAYISRAPIRDHSLTNDLLYIKDNLPRIVRALVDIFLEKNDGTSTDNCIQLLKCVERRMWDDWTPFQQFSTFDCDLILKIERMNLGCDTIEQEDVGTLQSMLRVNYNTAKALKRYNSYFPQLELDVSINPITATVVQIRLFIEPRFIWADQYHKRELFWVWVEIENEICHYEHFKLNKKQVVEKKTIDLSFTVPIRHTGEGSQLIRVVSERWIGCDYTHVLSLRNVVLPHDLRCDTVLHSVAPLPIELLGYKHYRSIYNFTHFNPMQSNLFHSLYHTDDNIFLGAPTGSGKTIVSELALLRLFRTQPEAKAVYIAPMKALVRERVNDWKKRFEQKLGLNVVEITGDVTPRRDVISSATIIITTPEKWDILSRSWRTKLYVQNVSLMIIDEVHLLGEERGAVLEVIVSRFRFIHRNSTAHRIVALSTASANALDLAHWLGVKECGIFNYGSSARPVPLDIHISGFPEVKYCPRMADMNKPAYQAIRTFSPTKPVLVFVSSRRQTRLTAIHLITYLTAIGSATDWLHMPSEEMSMIISRVSDDNLKHTLQFGVGLHHAGLKQTDRDIVAELFLNQKIQVLVATSTLAWGVNFPAHLVIIKGTEYFDVESKRYVDMPISDVLQMMGRAGRPGHDTSGVAVVYVQEAKKSFYKKFLFEPFPIESHLMDVLPDHLNAEIAANTVKMVEEMCSYLENTFFYLRLMQNPVYYDVAHDTTVESYVTALVKDALLCLQEAGCIYKHDVTESYECTPFGVAAFQYYVSHKTIQYFRMRLHDRLSINQLILLLASAEEYSSVPVRHNEDLDNEKYSSMHGLHQRMVDFKSPHAKTYLLLYSYFSQLDLPIEDYYTDTALVLDQAVRIVQAMIDMSYELRLLQCIKNLIGLLQMLTQGRWVHDLPLSFLREVTTDEIYRFSKPFQVKYPNIASSLPMLIEAVKLDEQLLSAQLVKLFGANKAKKFIQILKELPDISVTYKVEVEKVKESRFYETEDDKAEEVEKTADPYWILKLFIKRKGTPDQSVVMQRTTKSNIEGWFIIVVNEEHGTEEIIHMSRKVLKNGMNTQTMKFRIPEGQKDYIPVSVYVLSDVYIGLDQQIEVDVKIPKNYQDL